MRRIRWMKVATVFAWLFFSASVFAGDVGMIGDDATATQDASGDLVMVGDGGAANDDRSEGFLHVDAGMVLRNLQNDSGLFCLNATTSSFGSPCSVLQSFKHGKQTFLWSGGLGFRYNAVFALDFAYWGMEKPSTQVVFGSSYLSLRTWMVSALYQAQLKLFSRVYLMPQVGVVYVSNTASGVNNSTSVHARTVNWRPALGLAVLWSLSSHFALNLSGVYVPESGHSPTMAIRYPSMQLLSLGLRYAF